MVCQVWSLSWSISLCRIWAAIVCFRDKSSISDPDSTTWIMPTRVSARTVAASATSMMVKPRADVNFRVSGNSRTFRLIVERAELRS